MMVAKRSPERLSEDPPTTKKLKTDDSEITDDVITPGKITGDVITPGQITGDVITPGKSKSKRRNETILVNPQFEEKIEADEARRVQLNTSANLVRVFESEGFTLHSPDVFSYTNCGQVPHVTADLCSTDVNGDVSIVSLHSVLTAVKVMERLGKTLAEFVNTTNKIILTPYNSAEPCDLTNFNDQLGMSVWSRGGRKRLSSKEYVDVIKVCGPEMFVCLSDVVPSRASKKRANKSCYRTLQWVTEAMTLQSENSALKSRLLAPLPGSGHRQLMMKSARLLATRDVFGYVIERATLPGSGWQDLIKDVISILPPSRPVIMLGVLNECEMVAAYNCGCHFVDSSFVLHYSNNGHALALHTHNPAKLSKPLQQSEQGLQGLNSDFGPSLAENVPKQATSESDGPRKKTKETGKVPIFKPHNYIPNEAVTLDLTSPGYTRQFTKLVDSCECFSCSRHTRGYINHLLTTKELLAPTLLMLHNLYHVKRVLKVVREMLQGGGLSGHASKLQELFALPGSELS